VNPHLRFPVWSRNRGDCELLVCVANWPAHLDADPFELGSLQ